MAEGGVRENLAFDPTDNDPEDNDDGYNEQDVADFLERTYTPGPPEEEMEMQTFQHEQSGLPETPSFEGFVHQDDRPAILDRAREFIKRKFPRVNFARLGPIGFSKKPETVGKIVSFGPKGGETEIFRKDGRGLLKKFTDKFKSPLGPEAESLIAQDNESIRETRQSLIEAEGQLQQAEKINAQKEEAAQELQNLRNKLEQTQAKIDQLGSSLENEAELRRLQQLKKNYKTDFENKKKELTSRAKQAKNIEKVKAGVDKLRVDLTAKEKERNTTEERLNSTKPYDELKEQEAELQRQNEEDKAIIEDANTSPSEREAAEVRVAERNEELARLGPQIEERERAMPLRERVKEIFKKHGVTLTAIVLAAGVTIGAVIGAITNALKSMGKGIANGLKTIGQKTASLIPGLIGSIVSFLFKTAGQVVGFLAEHTWLLILAVVAILVEGYIKKQR